MAPAAKSVFSSRTNWFALAVALIPLLEVVAKQPVVSGKSWIFVALGIAIAALRSVTRGPVKAL